MKIIMDTAQAGGKYTVTRFDPSNQKAIPYEHLPDFIREAARDNTHTVMTYSFTDGQYELIEQIEQPTDSNAVFLEADEKEIKLIRDVVEYLATQGG